MGRTQGHWDGLVEKDACHQVWWYLSSILGTHMVEGQNWFQNCLRISKIVPWCIHIYAGICMHTYIHSHIQIKNLKRLEGLESWLRSTCCSWGGHRFCFHPPTTTCNPYFRGSDALFWLLQALHYTAYIQTKRHMIQIQMIFLFLLLFFVLSRQGFSV